MIMGKKYYDSPQLEIVNIQIGQHLLDASPVEELGRGSGTRKVMILMPPSFLTMVVIARTGKELY